MYTFEEKQEIIEYAEWYNPILDCFGIPELEPFVVYTFYDKELTPIYTGKTISFIDRFVWHSNQEYYDLIEYIGFRQYDNRAEMELGELFYIQHLQPKYNKASKYDPIYKNIKIEDFTNEIILSKNLVCDYCFSDSDMESLLQMVRKKAII